jgi:hypothetical protein
MPAHTLIGNYTIQHQQIPLSLLCLQISAFGRMIHESGSNPFFGCPNKRTRGLAHQSAIYHILVTSNLSVTSVTQKDSPFDLRSNSGSANNLSEFKSPFPADLWGQVRCCKLTFSPNTLSNSHRLMPLSMWSEHRIGFVCLFCHWLVGWLQIINFSWRVLAAGIPTI